MSRKLSRRVLTSSTLATLAAASVGVGRHDQVGLAHNFETQDATPLAQQPDEGLVGEAAAPAWRFGVSIFEDPYRGTIRAPSDTPPGTRFVGAEVVITNDSEQPLEFAVNDVRLQDDRGFQYPAGDVTGTEPRLVSQNLPDSERTRGWVWFLVPIDAQPTQMAFNGPPPAFRVVLAPAE